MTWLAALLVLAFLPGIVAYVQVARSAGCSRRTLALGVASRVALPLGAVAIMARMHLVNVDATTWVVGATGVTAAVIVPLRVAAIRSAAQDQALDGSVDAPESP